MWQPIVTVLADSRIKEDDDVWSFSLCGKLDQESILYHSPNGTMIVLWWNSEANKLN